MANFANQPLLDSPKRKLSFCKSLSLVLSLVAIITPITILTTKLFNETSSSSSNSLSLSATLCHPALNQPLCSAMVSELAPPEILMKMNGPDVLQAFLKKSASGIRKSMETASDVRRRINDPREQAGLADCLELMELSIDRVMESVVAIEKRTSRSHSDAHSWLSGVLTNHVTCLDGLTGSARSMMEPELEDMVARARAFLAMVVAVSPPEENEASNKFEPMHLIEEFPRWVTGKDRKLLEAVAGTVNANVVVAQDGSGNYKTVNEAVASAPNNGNTRYVIYVKKGTYKENVVIGSSKTNVMCKKFTEHDMEEREGGWNPVLRRRKSTIWQTGYRSEQGLITIFVDHIPESMDPKGLFNLFSKFGIVKDVFIPRKRRQATRSRFGFVRYDCAVAAEVAIQKTNGLWCDNRALQVKKAEFQKTQSFDPMVRRRIGTKEGGQRIQNQLQGQQIQFQGGKKSYAEVLVNGGASEREEVVIKTFEEGNGWGYESLVVTMRNFFAFKEFRAELYKRGMKDVIARECGGRLVVLTFSSVKQMKEGKAKLSAWGQEWCDSVKEWGEGHYVEQERCVWLCCFGIPINLWSVTTFRSIATHWGTMIQLEEDVNNPQSFQQGRVRVVTRCMKMINTMVHLECKGTLYPVRVCEELPRCLCPSLSSSRGIDIGLPPSQVNEEVDQLSGNEDCRRCVQKVPVPRGEVMGGRSEEESRVMETEIEGPVMVNKDDEGQHAEAEGVLQGGMGHANVGACSNKEGLVQVVNSQQVMMKNFQISNGVLGSSGPCTEMCGPEEGTSKINLEVVLEGLHVGPLPSGLDNRERLTVEESEAQPRFKPNVFQSIQNNLDRSGVESSKVKEVAGKATSNNRKKGSVNKQRGVLGSFGFQRGAIFRATAAAVASSLSSSQKQSRCSTRNLIEEAKSTLKVGAILGLQYQSREQEVVNKIVELEENDVERLAIEANRR